MESGHRDTILALYFEKSYQYESIKECMQGRPIIASADNFNQSENNQLKNKPSSLFNTHGYLQNGDDPQSSVIVAQVGSETKTRFRRDKKQEGTVVSSFEFTFVLASVSHEATE